MACATAAVETDADDDDESKAREDRRRESGAEERGDRELERLLCEAAEEATAETDA